MNTGTEAEWAHCNMLAEEYQYNHRATQSQLRALLLRERAAAVADITLAREAAIARAERAELELDEVKAEASEQAAKLSLLVSAVEAVLNKADVEGIREWRCIRALRRVLEGAK